MPKEDRPGPWTCSECGHTREPYPNHWTGKWVLDTTSPCEICATMKFAGEQALLARQNALRNYGLIGGRYEDMTFKSYIPDPDYPKQALAKQAAMDLVEEWRQGNWDRGMIIGGGDVGVGKTHLAISAAREGVYLYTPQPGERILTVWGVPDMLTAIKNSYNNGGPAHILESVHAPAILVLDDLGVEHVKQESWLQEIMYGIFNTRWLDKKAVIVTTNKTPNWIERYLGDRTWSRLAAVVGAPVHIQGKDYRKNANE